MSITSTCFNRCGFQREGPGRSWRGGPPRQAVPGRELLQGGGAGGTHSDWNAGLGYACPLCKIEPPHIHVPSCSCTTVGGASTRWQLDPGCSRRLSMAQRRRDALAWTSGCWLACVAPPPHGLWSVWVKRQIGKRVPLARTSYAPLRCGDYTGGLAG